VHAVDVPPKELATFVSKYIYRAGERVHRVEVLLVELATVGFKVYLLSW
jgi:hypothetical protein